MKNTLQEIDSAYIYLYIQVVKPIYAEIYSRLRSDIEAGRCVPGERLPSESLLSSQFSASRMTVRKSLQLLVQHGFASVRAGLGYFVRDREIELRDNRLRGFTDEIRSLGRTPSSDVVASGVVHRAQIVGLPESHPWGDPFLMIQRVRYGDGEPLVLETGYYDLTLCADLPDHVENDSVYAILESRYGVYLKRADQIVRALAISEDDADYLGLDPGSPGLHLERTTFDSNNRPIEFVRATFRADSYRIRMSLDSTGGNR